MTPFIFSIGSLSFGAIGRFLMAVPMDFDNHRRFTPRCLKEDLVPVSIRPTKNIRTPKSFQIIRRAQKALLNERVRLIINTINMLKTPRDTCIDHLGRAINEDWMDKCREFIDIGRVPTLQDLRKAKR